MRLIVQIVSSFDQFLQPLCKTGSRRAVHDIMIEADRHAQELTCISMRPSKKAGFCVNAAQRHLERVIRRRDAPAAARTEHADGTEQHRAVIGFDPGGAA
jgi:hypothetical protein